MCKLIFAPLTSVCLLAVFVLSSCRRAAPEGYQNTVVDTLGCFVVNYDTLLIDTTWLKPGAGVDLASVVRYHDRYYLDIEEFKDRCFTYHLFSFTTDGCDLRDLDDQRLFLTVVRNDSLLSIDHRRKESRSNYGFCLDPLTWSWDSVPGLTLGSFYEDDDYSLIFDDHGEWGYYTSFISKATGQDYVWYMFPKRFFRFGDRYFNLCPTVLQWVEEPTKGVEHPGQFRRLEYEKSRANTFANAWDNEENGWELFFYFSTNCESYTEIYTMFLNAFVVDEELYVVTSAPEETYISCYRNDSLQKVMGFGQHFDFEGYVRDWNVSDHQYLPRNEALLWFYAGDQTLGIMDIVNFDIHVTYVKFDTGRTDNE